MHNVSAECTAAGNVLNHNHGTPERYAIYIRKEWIGRHLPNDAPTTKKGRCKDATATVVQYEVLSQYLRRIVQVDLTGESHNHSIPDANRFGPNGRNNSEFQGVAVNP